MPTIHAARGCRRIGATGSSPMSLSSRRQKFERAQLMRAAAAVQGYALGRAARAIANAQCLPTARISLWRGGAACERNQVPPCEGGATAPKLIVRPTDTLG